MLIVQLNSRLKDEHSLLSQDTIVDKENGVYLIEYEGKLKYYEGVIYFITNYGLSDKLCRKITSQKGSSGKYPYLDESALRYVRFVTLKKAQKQETKTLSHQ